MSLGRLLVIWLCLTLMIFATLWIMLGGEIVREKQGGPTYETHLYERWQESKKLREDLEQYLRTSTTNMADGWGPDRVDLLTQALQIEEEAKAEYDAW